MRAVRTTVLLGFMIILVIFTGCSGGGEDTANDEDESDNDGNSDDSDSDSGESTKDGYLPGVGMIVTDSETGLRLLFPDIASLQETGKKTRTIGSEYDPNLNQNVDISHAREGCLQAAQRTGTAWRLPTISELRSEINECPDTEYDGICNVYDDCPEKDCWGNECNFACALLGAGPHPDGCYASDFFPSGTCGKY